MAVVRIVKTDLYSNGSVQELPLESPQITNIKVLQRENREYVEDDTDKKRDVKQEDTWQNIAFSEYKDSKYYHYLLDINNVFNPFDPVPVAEQIVIPPLTRF